MMDTATLIAAVSGAFAGTAFPAAVAWRFIGILTKDIRDLRDEIHGLRLELGKRILVVGPEAEKTDNNGGL